MDISQSSKRSLLGLTSLLLALQALVPMVAGAAPLTNAYLRLERMSAATNSQVRVVFTTSAGTATEDEVEIDFDGADGTAWTSSGTVNATQTVSSGSCAADTGATALPGTLSAAGSGSVVSVSGVTDLTASTAYCFDLTSASAVTTPSAGEYHPTISTLDTDVVEDEVTVATRVVANDEINVTASVPPSFNFVLDGNSTAFTNDLTAGTARTTTNRTVTVNTNAQTGWTAWARNVDANGLFSASTSKNIAPTTPGTAVDVDAAASTEQYVWGVSSMTQGTGDGTTTAAAAYDATGGTNDGSGLDTSYRSVASSDGTASGAVVTLNAKATISSLTPAASDYADTIQVIGAGNF